MGASPRVAFFADSFHEVNGLALTARSLDAYARRHALPLLCVRGASQTTLHGSGGLLALDLARSRRSVPLDAELSFDPLWWRHVRHVSRIVDRFAPDVVHVTGINDMGQLGVWMAVRRRIPLIASWHTNVHEFAARRMHTWLRWMPPGLRDAAARVVEQAIWAGLVQFYRIPRAVLVPNAALGARLEADTGRPVLLMRRGIDAEQFSPARRDRQDATFRLGYVGRLAPEKNVRALAGLERRLQAAGATAFEFVVVGDGSERPWLEQAMRTARFTGVLHGDALARAYAGMDLFVFPSETDTFGNVVLEALASGVPAVVSDRGGPQSVIRPGIDGLVASGEAALADAVLRLMTDGGTHARMRMAARTHALESSWDAVFQQVYEAYRAVIDGRATEVAQERRLIDAHARGGGP